MKNKHWDVEIAYKTPEVMSVPQQLAQRHAVLEHRRLDDDVAEVLRDADVFVEQAFHHLLIVLDAAGHEAHQVVVAAADQMAFEDFVNQADVGFELGEVFALVVAEGDLGEDGYRVGDLGQVQMRFVAGDITGRFKPFDPLQARAGRQADGIGKADVGHPAVLLQFDQDADVDPIQFYEPFHHVPLDCRCKTIF